MSNALYNLYSEADRLSLSSYEEIEGWIIKVSSLIRKKQMDRFNRLTFFTPSKLEHNINCAKAIILDSALAQSPDFLAQPYPELQKLIIAREENINFEEELAERICGINKCFPRHADIKKFFYDLGFPGAEHLDETGIEYVICCLHESDITIIAKIIEKGLFRKKYYKVENFGNRRAKNSKSTTESLIEKAKKDFAKFIDESISAGESLELAEILDLNMNSELLSSIEPNTKDNVLNMLITEAKDRFWKKEDRHIALEKIWDAFQRIKTVLDTDKRVGANCLVELISTSIEKKIFNSEFDQLTKIGNNYRIRHSETTKIELEDESQINYLFFRMLALIALCLKKLPTKTDK